jgi:endonuclease-3
LVTPALFAKYPDPPAMARAKPTELENLIRSTGFFRAKAKNLIAACRAIVEKHGGDVPQTLEELTKLPGVGRKTANVVLGNCFDVPGITVDTHVGRLSRRLGFTNQTDAEKVERDLMQVWPKKDWTLYSHRMIFHGRQVCFARRPACSECAVLKLCPQIGVTDSQ